MGLEDETVTGRNGTYPVTDRVGTGTNWETYNGHTDAGEPILIRRLQGDVLEASHDRFHGLMRQWASITDRESARDVVDWGVEPEPWVGVEYVPEEKEQFGAGKAVESILECDVQTKAELVADVCEIIQTYSRYGSTPHHLTIHPDCLSFWDGSDGPVAVVDDWGLSRLITNPPVTPYTAPEQLEDGGHASKQTDVYRVGALATHLFSETALFTDAVNSDDPEALKNAIQDGIDDAMLPDAGLAPISRAMSHDPTDRYATTNKFRRDLLKAVPASEDRNSAPLAAVTTPTPVDVGTDEGNGTDTTGTNDVTAAGSDDAVSPAASTTSSNAVDNEPVGAPTPERSGSRRSILKYGVAILGGAGAAYLGIPLLTGNDPLGNGLSNNQFGADGSASNPTSVTGGSVQVDVGSRSWLETLPSAASDTGIPDEVSIQINSEQRAATNRVEEFTGRIEATEPKPDLMVLSDPELGMLVEAGVTEPIGQYTTDSSIDDALTDIPGLFEEVSRAPDNGVYHAVPYGFMPLVNMYHKGPFREIGADDGVFESWMTNPPSWEQWSHIAAEGRETIGSPFGFIWGGDSFYLSTVFTAILTAFGGAYYEDVASSLGPIGERRVTVDSSQGLEAANIIHDLVTGGNRSDRSIRQCTTGAVFSLSIGEVQELFRQEEAVAAQLPVNMAYSILDDYDADEIGIMPMPVGSDGSATTSFGSYVAMNPHTENLGESLAVANAFRSTEFAEAIVSQQGSIPFGRQPLADELFAGTNYEPYVDALQFIVESTVVEPAGNAWVHRRSEINDRLQNAITGSDPQTELTALAQAIED